MAYVNRPPRTVASKIHAFSQLILAADEAAAILFVEQNYARGVDVRTVFLNLFTPAARRLGEMWENDTASFSDVTVGLGRLHRVMKHFSNDLYDAAPPADAGRRILLVSAPGEQHTFGLAMLAEFFRHAKWDVATEMGTPRRDLCRLLRNEWFAVIGFSAGSSETLASLATTVRAVRQASLNRSLRVMVGGPAFLADPDLVVKVGADTTATDGRHAVIQAEHLLALSPARG